MRIALIDIDGPIAINTNREQYANDVVEMRTNRVVGYASEKTLEQLKKEVFYHKHSFYKESLVLEDELVSRAKEDLSQIWQANWTVKYLTSRPDYLQDATDTWLRKHGLTSGEVFCKNIDAFQYTRSDLWKMGVVEILIRTLDVRDLIFVDDEQKNRIAILTLAEKYKCNIQAFDNLLAAAEYANSPDEDGNW